jgi:type IV fimbrial biogenesis protein FimT
VLKRRARGATLVELMIGLAVLALLVGIGVPAFRDMMKNYQIRTAAESLIGGLQTARNEAVRRNTTVRFQLVNTLDADCTSVQSGPHWVVSRNDPSTKCDQAPVTDFLEPNDTAQPQILMKANNASNGTATINATAGGGAGVRVIFNSLGRVDPGSIDTIDVTNPSGGNCESDASPGNMRCMRIRVGAGGQVRMCDPSPNVTATDSRYCQ